MKTAEEIVERLKEAIENHRIRALEESNIFGFQKYNFTEVTLRRLLDWIEHDE